MAPIALQKIKFAAWKNWVKHFTSDDLLDLSECQVDLPMVDAPDAFHTSEVHALGMPVTKPDGWYETFEPYGPHHRDSDKLIPYWNHRTDVNFATTFTQWNSNGWVTTWQKYNTAKIESYNPGPNDWRAIRRHERAHAGGWNHWEGTPQTNAAYYPVVRITHT